MSKGSHEAQMNKLKLYISCFVLLLCGALFAANEQDSPVNQKSEI